MKLSADDLRVCLGGREVLHGPSVGFRAGELAAIVGPNGSGKSTLLRALAGVIRPCGGRVRLADRPLGSLSRRELARARGLLTQTAEIPPLTTVIEHVTMGRHAHRPMLRRGGDDAGVVRDAMRRCEIRHLADRRLDELSGGERQRVRIATLLAQDPRVMLLDEPLAGLDIEHQLSLLHLLVGLHAADDRTVVCVLHDLDLALRFFPRVIVVHDGRIVADGPPRSAFTPELFRTVFRVEGRVGCECSGHPVTVCEMACPAARTGRNGAPVEIRRTAPSALRAAVLEGVAHA